MLACLVALTPLTGYGWDNAARKTNALRKSWTELRNHQVIRQEFDYSCGAASLATLLTYYYHRPTSEQDILDLVGESKREAAISFQDMRDIAAKLGYRSLGLASDLEGLRNLKVPAVLYFHRAGQDHFTVYKGSNDQWIWLADPTWGNRRMDVKQFLSHWQTKDSSTHYGRLFLVLPQAEAEPPIPPARDLATSLTGRNMALENLYKLD